MSLPISEFHDFYPLLILQRNWGGKRDPSESTSFCGCEKRLWETQITSILYWKKKSFHQKPAEVGTVLIHK